ncbi:MAG: hypothetical protein MI920_25790, partial [Kiloniellales bacterium]|nr:hypothetical protein [Kiloniellales bacterium]
VGIAALFRYQPELRDRITRHGNGLLGAGLLVLLAGYFLFGGSVISAEFSTLRTTLIGFPLISLGYGLIVVSALSPSSFLYRLTFRPTAALATLAYAIYLIHKMTNHWINTRLHSYVELSETQTFLVCLVAAVLGGWLLHKLVEAPFLTLRDRLAARSA